MWLSDSARRMAWGLGLLSLVVGAFALWRWWAAGKRPKAPSQSEEAAPGEAQPSQAAPGGVAGEAADRPPAAP